MSKRNSFLTALDIGTNKIGCFIAQRDGSGEINVIGIGHQLSQGIKSGVITDIKLAEKSIRSAVGAAEQMAGVNVDRVVVNISGAQQKSSRVHAEMAIANQAITNRDINLIINQGCEQSKTENNDIIHCIPINYSVDQTSGIKDPVGMFANSLAVTLNVVNIPSNTLYNLANCLAQCHLDIENYVISPYASGLSCLGEDEKELGVTLVDFGGGNTSISVFREGKLAYCNVLPVGGNHITNDIAIGLSIDIADAERIKTLYGNVISSSKDEVEIIDLPNSVDSGIADMSHITKSSLVNIIRPRVEEILEMVKANVTGSVFGGVVGNVVITGGASQLGGLKELSEQILGKRVRMGIPKYINGMAENTKGPAFATCSGILLFSGSNNVGYHDISGKDLYLLRPFDKMIRWFKDNF